MLSVGAAGVGAGVLGIVVGAVDVRVGVGAWVAVGALKVLVKTHFAVHFDCPATLVSFTVRFPALTDLEILSPLRPVLLTLLSPWLNATVRDVQVPVKVATEAIAPDATTMVRLFEAELLERPPVFTCLSPVAVRPSEFTAALLGFLVDFDFCLGFLTFWGLTATEAGKRDARLWMLDARRMAGV